MKTRFLNQVRLMILLMLTLFISASWAQNTITVQLRDSDGNIVPEPETAYLEYYSGGWHLIPNDGSGNFLVDVSILPKTLRMLYHATSQDVLVDGNTDPVVFITVSFKAEVRNANNELLSGGIYYVSHYTNQSVQCGSTCEVLPGGDRRVTMKYHTSQVAHWITVPQVPSYTEVFTTTTVVPRLLDCEGNEIAVINDPPWHLWHGNVGPCDGCHFGDEIQVLTGSSQRFRLFYNWELTGDQWVSIPSTPIEVLFYAPGIAEAFVWNDVDENGIQDMGELGLSGVQVDIIEPNGNWLMTAYTNSNGIASFIDYPWGVPIKMHVYVSVGMEPTKSSGPKTDPKNSDIDKNGLTPAFSGGSCATFIDWIGAGLIYSNAAKANSGSPIFNLYPNPASYLSTVTYYLAQDSQVNIRVFDLTGRQVSVIDHGVKTAGQNTTELDVSTLEPGIYFLKYEVGDNVRTERFVVTR